MKRALHVIALVVCFAALTAAQTPLQRSQHGRENDEATAPSAPASAAGAKAKAVFSRLPLAFEENRGQTDAQVKYLSHGPGYDLYLTRDRAVFALRGEKPAPACTVPVLRNSIGCAEEKSANGQEKGVMRQGSQGAALWLKFAGASSATRISGIDKLEGTSNYFIGNDRQKWHTKIPNYERVRYGDLYPGVDLVYYGNQQQLEFDFAVAPGANPHAIELDVEGAQRIQLDTQGELILQTNAGEVRLLPPGIYQTENGARRNVEGRYRLLSANRVGFEIGAYDRSKTLVIDPTAVFSTFLGGSGFSGDAAFGIAQDASGIYVTGQATSRDFPGADPFAGHNEFQTPSNVFITKFNPAGSQLIYSTLISGSSNTSFNEDSGNAIAVDLSGSVVVVGSAAEPDFPTVNPFQATMGNVGQTSFILKLSADGSSLNYSTFFGGRNTGDVNNANGVAVDSNGNACAAGDTTSANFPTVNPFQAALKGRMNGWVAKFNSAGQPVFSTYLGGTSNDSAVAIAVDKNFDAYVTGFTQSTDFPVVPANAFQTSLRSNGTKTGFQNAFVTKFSTDGLSLVYSTYLGGSNDAGSNVGDTGFGITVDGNTNAYVTGQTDSLNFPQQPNPNPIQPAGYGGGGSDAFVTKISTDGTALAYSTYLGGEAGEFGNGIGLDSGLNAYIAGGTRSTKFPLLNPLQGAQGGARNAFVASINTAGNALIYSTYLGGRNLDAAFALAADSSGNAYVAGLANSENFPVVNALQQFLFSSAGNAFVAKLSPAAPAGLTVFPAAFDFREVGVGATSLGEAITLSNNTGAAVTINSFVFAGANAGDFAQTNNCPASPSTLASGGSCIITITFSPSLQDDRTATLTINSTASGSAPVVTLSGRGAVPQINLSTTAVNFGSNDPLDVTQFNSVILQNTGGVPLHISSIQISGPNASDFTTSNCLGAIPRGGSCFVTLSFTPSAAGTRNATLTINDDATGSPQTVSLTGVGVATVFASPNPGNFGPQLVGVASFERDLFLINGSGATITLDPMVGVVEGGADPGDFPIDAKATTCLNGLVMKPGATCFVAGRFLPAATGMRSATITFTFSGASGSPVVANIQGTGVTGVFVQNVPFDFFSQFFEIPSFTRSDLLVNGTNTPLNVTSLVITGPNAADFTVTLDQNCAPANVVPPQTACSLDGIFTPSMLGSESANLAINFTGPAGSPLNVALTGTGVPGPVIVTTNNFNNTLELFGSEIVNTTGSPQRINFLNQGRTDVHISSTSLGGANAADFAFFGNSTCVSANQVTVKAGGSCNIFLTFTPGATGARAGTLTITSDDPASPRTISLTGIGEPAVVSLSTNPLDFGNVTVGKTSAAEAVFLINAGTGAITVTANVAPPTGTNAADFTVLTAAGTTTCVNNFKVLGSGGTCAVVVTFKPSMQGQETASITITDSEGSHPVNLTGNGILTPQLTRDKTFINFNSQAVGSTSAAQTVTVTNVGNGPLTLSSVAISRGTNPGDFAIATGTTCTNGFVVPANNGTCIINLTFDPTAAGFRNAELDIFSNSNNNNNSDSVVFLSGQGLTGGVSVAPTTVDFGAVALGTTEFQFQLPSAENSILLTNNTANSITLTTTKTGTNAADFTTSFGNCTTGTVIPANGGTCTISDLQFTPTVNGAETATLTFSFTGASGSPINVALKGSGSNAVVANPNPAVFASTPVNPSFAPQLSVTLTNGSTSAVSITSIGAPTGPNASFFSILTQFSSCTANFSLSASGGQCSLDIQFSPTAPGNNLTAQISIGLSAGGPLVINLQGAATAPVVQLQPSSLQFNPQTVNTQSVVEFVTLNNIGNDNLQITKVTITGANANDFALANSNNPCFSFGFGFVQPAGTCTIGITFTPSGTGTRNGLLTLTDNASPTTQTVQLVGNGQAGQVTVNPTSLTFQSQQQGTTSAPQTIVLKNATNGSVTLTVTALGGANPGDFAFASGTTCTNGAKIPSLTGTCVFNVTFTPQGTGTRAASFSVSDGIGDNFPISLQGTGINPIVTVSPNPLNFPGTAIGSTSGTLNVTLTNSTAAAVTISSTPAIGGTNASEFGIVAATTSCNNGTVVAANGGSCQVSLNFKPTATGNQTATLTIADTGENPNNSPHIVTLNGAGTAPSVSLSTNTLNFGSEALNNTTPQQTVTLTNSGTASLTISSVSAIGGTNPGDFAFAIPASGSDCRTIGSVAANGGTCVLAFTFTPTALNARSATVTVTDNDKGTPNSMQTITLQGTGVNATAVFNPNPLNFNNQRQGTQSAVMTSTLTNSASQALNISNVSALGGANPGDFAFAAPASGSDCRTVGSVAANGGTCVLAFTFTPTAVGTRSASVTVTDNGSPTTQTLNLSGTGIFPQASASPNPVNFNNQRQGTTSAAQTVTLTNGGTDTLHITTVALGGTNPGDFAITSNGTTCTNGSTVSAGGNCIVNLTFTPSALGSRTATLTFTDDASPTTQIVNLNGTGVFPQASPSPNPVNFGNQRQGTTSAVQTVTLANGGTDTLHISTVALGGTNSGDFAITSNGTTCTNGSTVSAGGNCVVKLTFTPTATGNRTATLTFTDDASPTTQTVNLNGTGIFPQASPSPATVNFNNQTTGTTSAPMTVTLTNGGTDTLHISTVALGGTNPSDFAITSNGTTCTNGSTVNAGGNCIVNLTFTPASTTQFTATLTFTDDATPTTQTVNLMGTGVASSVLLNPSTIQFGNQRVGTTSGIMTSTLTNNGTATLMNIMITIGGTNAGDFAFATPPGGATDCTKVSSVPVGGTCVIAATFTPTATGSRSATAMIADNASGSPQTLTLTGNGTAPAVTLSTNSLNFNNQIIMTTSAAMTATLTNSGTAPLNITGAGILITTDSTDFAISGNTCPSAGNQLAPQASCVVSLQFNPQTTGLKNGTVTINDDATPNPQTISLSGTGVTPPTATLSANSLAFGNQRVGVTSAAQNVTLTNNGGAPLAVTSITITGASPGDYAFAMPATTCPTGNGGGSVAAGANCVLSVTFDPQAAGSRSASISIADNAAGSPQSVALTGTGIAPAVTLAPASVDFGNQQVGTTSASKNGTLTNSGTDTLHISNVAITGANAGDFAVVGASTTCTSNSTVNATANCAWAVTFTPTATGARTASLSFTDDATGSPQSVTFSGNGTAPAVSLSPASVDFGIQAVNTTSAAKNGTLTNTGTATLHISNVAITGTNAGDFAIVGPSTTCTNGSTVAPNNGTCAWAVTFTPSAAGTRTASLSFTDDAAGSPQSVTLTGATPPVATLSANSINFNSQGVGTASAAQTVTLTNSGGSPLNITGIALSGPNAADFAITSNGNGACTNTSSVAAAGNCAISLTFTPAATGNRTATLSITDNAAGSPQTVSLAGTGIDFAVAGPSSPVTTTAGQPVMATITVTPGANGFPNSVTFSASNLPPLSTGSFSPPSVTPMGAAATTVLTITTKRRVAEPVKGTTIPPLAGPTSGLWLFGVLLGLLSLVMLRRAVRTQRVAAYLAVALLLCFGCGAILTGCSNNAAGTPPGTYMVTVTATSGQLSHTTTVTVVVQ